MPYGTVGEGIRPKTTVTFVLCDFLSSKSTSTANRCELASVSGTACAISSEWQLILQYDSNKNSDFVFKRATSCARAVQRRRTTRPLEQVRRRESIPLPSLLLKLAFDALHTRCLSRLGLRLAWLTAQTYGDTWGRSVLAGPAKLAHATTRSI